MQIWEQGSQIYTALLDLSLRAIYKQLGFQKYQLKQLYVSYLDV